MIPLLFSDFPSSATELKRPGIEYVLSIYPVQSKSWMISNEISTLPDTGIFMGDYLLFSGATVFPGLWERNFVPDESNSDFFTGDFDVNVKLPIKIKLKKKVKINSISKYIPNNF